MTVPLQIVDAGGVGGLLFLAVAGVLVVAVGSFLGVSFALQSFFEASTWEDAADPDREQ